ncbi:hypothetical protein FOQG_18497 [Fusarium oxysporum f. sp. raphani 54005]|uniref:Uncharacterized protein n=1 Tax=Fusarium oxysporum f. sp. raphani 54005 TaxID=1089458 RepID=X0BE79_FUSOX|nr:hypothetical protein FOQG_18497 [Fusarium oxysporum f. sp. raphani 54005]
MKPVLVSLGWMAMLASATPILSDPATTLPVKGDGTLDRRAVVASDSRDTAASNTLEKRAIRKMVLPNRIGSVIQNIGVIVVKAIVDAAGELISQITNNSPYTYQVSLREHDVAIDAAIVNVAAHHTIEYDKLGGIKPGAIISVNTQTS